MEKEVKDQLVEKLLEYMQESKDFLVEQAPELIQQIFAYHLYSAWVEFSFSLSFLVICVCVALYFWFFPTIDKYESRDMLSTFGVFLPGLISFYTLIVCYTCLDKLLKLYLAPKYFLISLIMGMKK